MTQKNLGTSQKVLISNADKNGNRPRKLPQYIASLSAALGALAGGIALGWSSPAGNNGAELNYNFEIDENDFSWVSSMITLGAAATSIPTGMLSDVIGRRGSLLITIIPYTIGWACVIWPNAVETVIWGRFLLGLSTGAFCVAFPIYTAEIADVETRGRLGSYLELNFVLGILMVYIMSVLHNMFLLSIISAVTPFIFFATFYFMPETPTYHLMKGNEDAARKTLIWLRGSHYDVEPELDETRNALDEAKRNEISFFVAIRSRATLKGFFIGFGLMFFEQLSGIGAITLYGGSMFVEATGKVSDWPMIIVGILQVIAVLLNTLIIDNWGRKIPLFLSGTIMCIMSLVLGVYFFLNHNNEASLDNFKWLPLVSMCGFVLAFEFGFGPIPWLITGEIFSAQVQGVAASCVCSFNWLSAFAVTKFYVDIKNQIGPHGAFWLFSAVSGLSVLFVFLAVPETKGKTLEEIQIELSGSSVNNEEKKKQSIAEFKSNYDSV